MHAVARYHSLEEEARLNGKHGFVVSPEGALAMSPTIHGRV